MQFLDRVLCYSPDHTMAAAYTHDNHAVVWSLQLRA